MGASAAALMSSSSSAVDITDRYYELAFYKMHGGPQGGRMDRWAENTFLPLMDKYKMGPAGFFKLAIGVDTPQLMMLIEHSSVENIGAQWMSIQQDPDWQRGLDELEKGSEPPFDKLERRLLKATPYSPPLSDVVGKSTSSRIFEFRVYHSPTIWQLQALHERFSGPEIKLFHKSGIFPILYADTIYGPDCPNLTYLMPFASLEAREKAWEKFRTDPEWRKVSAESKKKSGQIVAYIHRLIFNAVEYSPIR